MGVHVPSTQYGVNDVFVYGGSLDGTCTVGAPRISVKPSEKLSALVGKGLKHRPADVGRELKARGYKDGPQQVQRWKSGRGFDGPSTDAMRNRRIMEEVLGLDPGHFAPEDLLVGEAPSPQSVAGTSFAVPYVTRAAAAIDPFWRGAVEAYLQSDLGKDTPGAVAVQLVFADYRAMQCDPQSVADIHFARQYFQAKTTIGHEAAHQVVEPGRARKAFISHAWTDKSLPAAWVKARDEDYAKFGQPSPRVDERLAQVVHAKRATDLRGKTAAKAFREARVSLERELKA